jgi:hypothetical protein
MIANTNKNKNGAARANSTALEPELPRPKALIRLRAINIKKITPIGPALELKS